MAKPLKGPECLNCGHATGDNTYCSNCGQLNDTRRLSFWELVTESLSNFLAFDGKVFRTLWLTLIKPGQVAADFKSGKRVRYMNPIRFYFLSSILLITTIQINRGDPDIIKFTENGEPVELVRKENTKSSIGKSIELARLSEAYKKDVNRGFFNRFDYVVDYLDESPESSKQEIFGAYDMEESFWNNFIYDQAIKVADSRKEGNFSKFNRAFLNKLFWILFLFIPVFGLVLQVIYWRRDFYYPEHLFFTLYQQSLFFILAGLYNILFPAQESIFIGILMAFALHLLLAMRRFYQQSWRKTILKFILINISGIAAFGLFFLLSAIVVFILL